MPHIPASVQHHRRFTAGDLRKFLEDLPDDAPILVEAGWLKFHIVNAFFIGGKTDDPGVVFKAEEIKPC